MFEAWHEYHSIITEVEDSLSWTAGHEGKQWSSHHGRAKGPATVQVCAAERPGTANGGKTNPISKAWRRTQGWLHTCLNSTSARNVEADGWRLRNYTHDLHTDDPALAGEAEAFLSWRGLVTTGALSSKVAMESLHAMAERKADAMEAAASKRAFKRHAAWLQEGPAKGLGRQHKLSRTATGWIPNKSVTELPNGEEDDVDGLTAEDQAVITRYRRC